MMKTLIDLPGDSAQRYADNPYMLEKRTDRNETLTSRETKKPVYKVAAGFLALGLKIGNHTPEAKNIVNQ